MAKKPEDAQATWSDNYNIALYFLSSNGMGTPVSFFIDNLSICPIRSPPTVGSYTADPLMHTDYYAGGAPMPGRYYSNINYRYGYNGKETDNEIKGTANSVDFSSRIYDPRLVLWLSVDPKSADQPGRSPFSYALGNPILCIDPDGEFPITIHVRSFAPFNYFGGGFKGDGNDRMFTTQKAAFKVRSEITAVQNNLNFIT